MDSLCYQSFCLLLLICIVRLTGSLWEGTGPRIILLLTLWSHVSGDRSDHICCLWVSCQGINQILYICVWRWMEYKQLDSFFLALLNKRILFIKVITGLKEQFLKESENLDFFRYSAVSEIHFSTVLQMSSDSLVFLCSFCVSCFRFLSVFPRNWI